jgi:hypothetical protein
MGWVILIVIIILVLALVIAIAGCNFKAQVRKAYEDALLKLKKDPNNPDLRESALKLGRTYADLARGSDGRSIFDEVALMNDINAACARATIGHNSVAKVEVTNAFAVSGGSVAQEIERLGQLLISGVITGEEFERGKTLFLGAPPDKAASAIELLQNLDVLKKKGVLSESEFNMKKWEILSERLIPGKLQAARLTKASTIPPPPEPSFSNELQIQCPSCQNSIMLDFAAVGSKVACPQCNQHIEFT